MKKILEFIFGKRDRLKNVKTMTLIKKTSDLDYVLMDALLIIIGQNPNMTVSFLQYELLKCGMMVQQPLLRAALEELKKHKAITAPILN